MGRPSKYPEEFRREAVELYRSSDRSRVEVAKSSGVSEVEGRLARTPTKTYQHRQVPLPPVLASELLAHLDEGVAPEPDAPVFHSPTGSELRYRAFLGSVWQPTLG